MPILNFDRPLTELAQELVEEGINMDKLRKHHEWIDADPPTRCTACQQAGRPCLIHRPWNMPDERTGD